MPEKKKKPLGADFNEGGLDKKGKPVKKAENKPSEDKEDNTKEESRIVSVLMFATGVLSALITIIPGSAGWNVLHKVLAGIFGLAVLLVPAILIYISVLIGLERNYEEIAKKALWCIGWTFLISSAIQIFTVGKIPGSDFSDYISEIYADGTEFRGGGVISLPIAGVLFGIFGSMGAKIVITILFFVIILIITGKGLMDFFDIVSMPFKFISEFFIGMQSEDSGNYYYDDDEYIEDNQEDMEAIGMIENHNRYMPEPETNIEQTYLNQDDFSMFFDIPLPDDKTQNKEVLNPEPQIIENKSIDIPVKDVTAESDGELERLINNAAKKKPKQSNNDADKSEKNQEETTNQQLYILPALELLTPHDKNSNSTEAVAEMREKADTIVNTFESFSVKVKIKNIYRGPSITRYEIQPGAGVKVSKIKGLEDDIALSLAAQGVRIEAPVPGKAAVGIEVPNINKDTVTLREILESSEFKNSQSKLAFAVGKDIAGNAIVGDITKMPHVIIAGTTGSGKSVCTRSIIMSILYNAKPDEVKIILIDPKVVEFKVFEGIPHLLIPIVTEAKKAAGALNWAVNEMMRRYNKFADIGANDLKSYNEIAEDDDEMQKMPQIVIFIDELADMMLVAGKEVEDSICRLAQMGRAAGMHLVVATQRPTTDVITGLIKANIPSRIALSVMSQVDSRTIIDMAGADKLLGNGDMLYMPIGMSKPVRVQGCFASSKDINRTLDFIRSQAQGEYDSHIIEAVDNFVPQTKGDKGVSESGFEIGSDEDYVIRGAEVAVNAGQLSTTMLQKKLKLGYARASRIMDELEERGIISSPEGSKPRKVLMSKMQFDEWKLRQLEDK
ncbi:MAG: DNA translocase FtsK [Ruminococcus sp.]|nr:DNA translocase FtsK [Ruminococcus sp.]